MPSQETTNAVTERRVEALEEAVQALKEERDKALVWGIVTLGTAVIGLVTWIFNYLVAKK